MENSGAEAAARARPLVAELSAALKPQATHQRWVVGLHGGSGSGKSEMAAELARQLASGGVLVVAGDDYPRRVPEANDRERRRLYRDHGLQALVDAGLYTPARREILRGLQADDRDPAPEGIDLHPWLAVYQAAGRKALEGYLGQPEELDFAAVNRLLEAFRRGTSPLWVRHLGGSDDELRYEPVDVAGVSVLILEWTHAHSPHVCGVDVPVLLESTPEQTLGHRLQRNRDQRVDSPFTALVLSIEQAQLAVRADQVRFIVGRDGHVRRPS